MRDILSDLNNYAWGWPANGRCASKR